MHGQVLLNCQTHENYACVLRLIKTFQDPEILEYGLGNEALSPVAGHAAGALGGVNTLTAVILSSPQSEILQFSFLPSLDTNSTIHSRFRSL